MKKHLPLFFALLSASAFASVVTYATPEMTEKSLDVSFAQSGLKGEMTQAYALSAYGSAQYGCMTPEGNISSKQFSVSGELGQKMTYVSSPDGIVRGTIHLVTPQPMGTECGKGDTAALMSASYSNIVLYNSTMNIRTYVHRNIERTFRKR